MTQIIEQNSNNHVQEGFAPSLSTAADGDISAPQAWTGISTYNAGLPSPLLEAGMALPAHMERLAGQARGYVEAASSANTRKAYASDWKQFSGWCRRQGLEVLPPDPHMVGLYIAACAGGSDAVTASGAAIAGRKPNTVTTIERRLSAITWNYAQRGTPLDRKDRHIATVMAGIRNTHAAPPRQKEAVLPEHLIAMLETLPRGTLRACATGRCC